ADMVASWARRRRRETSPPSWSSASRVMAWTALLMDCKASGGIPPGSMMTSGGAAWALWATPHARNRQTARARIKSSLPCHDRGHFSGHIARQGRHIGRYALRNIVIGLGRLALGVGDHGGIARIGLGSYAQ